MEIRFTYNGYSVPRAFKVHDNYFDMNDEIDRESILCEIGQYLNSWNPDMEFPINVQVLNADDTVAFKGSVDMWLEPSFEGFVDHD